MENKTDRTRLPLDLRPDDREIIEAAASVKGLKMSTWTRVAAVEHSRELLDEEGKKLRAEEAGDE